MSINPDSPYEQEKKERAKISNATIPPPEDSSKQSGYKTKHSVVNKLPMHLGTLENKKKRRQLSEADTEDVAMYFGSSGAGVSKVDERTIYTDRDGGRY